jgi:sugar phosphate isomerase/epimerase
VAALARLDLSCCQLALGPLIDDPDRWSTAVTDLEAAGIRIVSGMFAACGEDYTTPDTIAATGGVRPDETWPATRDRAGTAAALAGAAGIPLVTFHAGFLPHDRADPLREIMLERLRRLVDVFAGYGVRVAFETGQETAATLVEALDDLDRPDAGVNFDPANMLLYGMGDPVDALRVLRRRVHQVHVKDAHPSPGPGRWGREVPAGAGAVDWPAFLAEVRAIEPPPALAIEREAGATREDDIARARDLVRRIWSMPGDGG